MINEDIFLFKDCKLHKDAWENYQLSIPVDPHDCMSCQYREECENPMEFTKEKDKNKVVEA